jgi:hypothetical protein
MRRTLAKHTLAALIVWPVAFFIAALLWLSTGPIIEARIAPVLVEQVATNVGRMGARVCWTWGYVKARPAVPRTFAFSFSLGGRAVRSAVPVRLPDGKALDRVEVRPPGAGAVDLCTEVPGDLATIPGLVILGSAEYETNHHLWTIWQDLPPVRVPDPN